MHRKPIVAQSYWFHAVWLNEPDYKQAWQLNSPHHSAPHKPPPHRNILNSLTLYLSDLINILQILLAWLSHLWVIKVISRTKFYRRPNWRLHYEFLAHIRGEILGNHRTLSQSISFIFTDSWSLVVIWGNKVFFGVEKFCNTKCSGFSTFDNFNPKGEKCVLT